MFYNITNLEKTHHESPQGLPLYVYKDLGTYRILTDGFYLYKELPDRKSIELFPIAKEKPDCILIETSPINQVFKIKKLFFL